MLRSGGHGRLTRCALLAVVMLLSCVAPAVAAPGFVAEETLSAADSSALDVAMAPNGYAIAGWVERTSGAPVVRVAVRPPGGPWSAPQSLPVGLDSADRVSVAIASSGAAAVTWEEVTSPSTFDVAVATRPAGAASFGAPEVLRDGSQSLSPSVGVAGDGTVTLLYTANPNVVLRDFPAGGSALAATLQSLAASCSTQFGNGVSVAPNGDAVAPLACGGASFALRTGGRWTLSPTVADDTHACPSGSTYHTAVMATIDSAGHAVGVLETHAFQPDPTTCVGPLQSDSYSEQLVLPFGGTMTPIAAPAANESSFGFAPPPISAPQAAISPSGIVFAWGTANIAFTSQAHVRFFALDGSGGTADQPVGTAMTGVSVVPRLALARDGRGLLSWLQGSGADAQIVAAERTPGTNAFGDPVPVSGRSDALSLPSLAMDDTGDGMAAWPQGTAPALVHVRGFDATAPVLSGVTIPSGARAGLPPAAFAASASDVWGPVTLSWAFGDGSSGSGGAPTHVYMSRGTFTATVTATDAAGNSSSQSGTVTVTPSTSGTLRITSASLTHKTFRVGRSATPLTGFAAARRRARVPVGTTVRFHLEVPRIFPPLPLPAELVPRVRIAIAHTAAGRLAGGRCVKPARRLMRHRRCTRHVVDGTLSRRAIGGASAVAFSGRIGRRPLAPGRYTATLTPFQGGTKAAPRTLRFAIVR